MRVLSYEVASKLDSAGEELRKSVRNGFERKFLLVVFQCLCDILRLRRLSLVFGKSLNRLFLLLIESEALGENIVRLTHMRAQYHLRAVIYEIRDSGKRAVDTVLIGDNAVHHRNVEIASAQAFFALYVNVADCQFCHKIISLQKLFLASCARVSTQI